MVPPLSAWSTGVHAHFVPGCWTLQLIVDEGPSIPTWTCAFEISPRAIFMDWCPLLPWTTNAWLCHVVLLLPWRFLLNFEAALNPLSLSTLAYVNDYTQWGKHTSVPIQTVQHLSVKLRCVVPIHTGSWANKLPLNHSSFQERTTPLCQEIPQPSERHGSGIFCLKFWNFSAMLQPSICVLCKTFQALKLYGETLHDHYFLLQMTSTPAGE